MRSRFVAAVRDIFEEESKRGYHLLSLVSRRRRRIKSAHAFGTSEHPGKDRFSMQFEYPAGQELQRSRRSWRHVYPNEATFLSQMRRNRWQPTAIVEELKNDRAAVWTISAESENGAGRRISSRPLCESMGFPRWHRKPSTARSAPKMEGSRVGSSEPREVARAFLGRSDHCSNDGGVASADDNIHRVLPRRK